MVHVSKTMRRELRSAIETNDALRISLLSGTVKWLVNKGRLDPEHFLEFQIQELPVLAYLYYVRDFLLDIYPEVYSSSFLISKTDTERDVFRK